MQLTALFKGLLTMTRITVDSHGRHYVRFKCPRCGRPLKSPIERIEKKVRCRECDLTFPVPGKEELEQMKKGSDQEWGEGEVEEKRSSAVAVVADRGVRLLFAGLVLIGTMLAVSTGAIRDLFYWPGYVVALLFGAEWGGLFGGFLCGILIVSLLTYCGSLVRGRK